MSKHVNYGLRNRLIKQYNTHGKLLVAVDFDDTVFPFSVPDKEVEHVRELIRRLNTGGHEVIVFTCRHDEEPVKAFYHTQGMKYDYFNESPVKDEEVGLGKIYFNVLLDDKAGLNEVYCTLESVLCTIEAFKSLPSKKVSL